MAMKRKSIYAIIMCLVLLLFSGVANLTVKAEDQSNGAKTESVSANQIVMVEKQKTDISGYYGGYTAATHKYAVSDATKASVSKTGILKAKKKGDVTVTLKIKNGAVWQDAPIEPITVHIYKPVVQTSYICNFIGKTESLESVLSYKNLAGEIRGLNPDCEIQLESTNPDVLNVNNGNHSFTPIKYGNAKLKIRFITPLSEGKLSTVSKSVKISVKEPELSVKSEIRLKLNKKKEIKLKNVPKTATVSWNSTVTSAVSVEGNGRKAVIKATNKDQTSTISAYYDGHEYSTVVNTYAPKDKADDTPAKEEKKQKCEVHFLDVGQGDCTLIVSDGHAMMIDGGPEDKGTAIQLYLTNHGITKLDYVILTHYDTDHIGGADVVIQKFNCDKIIMPAYTQNNAAYRNLMQVMGAKGYKSIVPKLGDVYELGDAKITILSPLVEYSSNYNNNSICLKVETGESSFLFTGDSGSVVETSLMNCGYDISADVYKVAHHGSRYSSSKNFLKKVSPEFAVVSCGAGNSYGHPHAEVLNSLRSLNVKLFRTDEQGAIIASTDGKKVTWNAAPSETWKAGEQSESDQDTDTQQGDGDKPEDKTPADITYVLNMNTKKFHKPSCGSVVTIASKNRKDVDWSRDKCIAEGYSPCNNCKP